MLSDFCIWGSGTLRSSEETFCNEFGMLISGHNVRTEEYLFVFCFLSFPFSFLNFLCLQNIFTIPCTTISQQLCQNDMIKFIGKSWRHIYYNLDIQMFLINYIMAKEHIIKSSSKTIYYNLLFVILIIIIYIDQLKIYILNYCKFSLLLGQP